MVDLEHMKAAEAYAESFSSKERVEKHIRKFTHPIDRVRSKVDLSIIAKYAEGTLFDCSIGFGRIIGELPNVTNYSGMDKSIHFVEFVKLEYPNVDVTEGDLLIGIEQPSNSYDSVLCIRTLPVLPNLPAILSEMKRITTPGGKIIVTYGDAQRSKMGDWKYTSSAYNIETIANELGLILNAKIRYDYLLAKIKKSQLLYRLFNSRFNKLPDKFYIELDKYLSRFFKSNSYMYILQKCYD